MGGNILACGSLLTVAVTVTCLVRFFKGKIPFFNCFIATIPLAIALSIIFPIIGARHNGGPGYVLVITSLCAMPAMMLVISPLRYHVMLIAFTWIMLVGLTSYAMQLLSEGKYTAISYVQDHGRDSLYFELEDMAETDTQVYPANWVSDEPFAVKIPEWLTWGTRHIPHAAWHSWFTGLYHLARQPVAAWFPGGRIRDARLMFRLRPGKTPPAR